MERSTLFITEFKEQTLNNTVHIKKITHQVLLASSIIGAVGLATQLSVKADATTRRFTASIIHKRKSISIRLTGLKSMVYQRLVLHGLKKALLFKNLLKVTPPFIA